MADVECQLFGAFVIVCQEGLKEDLARLDEQRATHAQFKALFHAFCKRHHLPILRLTLGRHRQVLADHDMYVTHTHVGARKIAEIAEPPRSHRGVPGPTRFRPAPPVQ